MTDSNYSLFDQFPEITEHHDVYPRIDSGADLKGSASGKVVFLSGASQGIGQATAVAFARAGAAAVYIIARSEHALQETQRKVMEANPATQCAYHICDVTDREQVKAAIKECVARFGGIDVADANAGYLGKWVKIAESDPDSWWRSWEINVKGSYYLIREAVTSPHRICQETCGYWSVGRPSYRDLVDRRAASDPRCLGLSSVKARNQSPLRVRACRSWCRWREVLRRASRWRCNFPCQEHAGRHASASGRYPRVGCGLYHVARLRQSRLGGWPISQFHLGCDRA